MQRVQVWFSFTVTCFLASVVNLVLKKCQLCESNVVDDDRVEGLVKNNNNDNNNLKTKQYKTTQKYANESVS